MREGRACQGEVQEVGERGGGYEGREEGGDWEVA